MSRKQPFALRRPCSNCPFRTDVVPYLTRARAIDIATSLADGATFPCHKTVDYETDDEPNVAESAFCAGALIMLEHAGAPNQMMRIGERLRLYDAGALDMDAPVHHSPDKFIVHHGGEPLEHDDESEPCSVCDPGCLAPAGYAIGGTVISEVDREPIEDCPECGEPVCDACTCYCQREDDDDDA